MTEPEETGAAEVEAAAPDIEEAEADVTDEVNVATAFELLSREEPPVACCPRDGKPLIGTFEQRGAEFHCLKCGGWFGYLTPTAVSPSPEVDAELARLQALWDSGVRGPSAEA